jgi:peptidylprolyl isomerase
MKTTTLSALAFVATALPLAAQTASTTTAKSTVHTTVHHSTAATSAGGCVTLPELSSKIPALPTGTPCAKALLTFTSVPSIRMDYVSPLVSEEIRESLPQPPATFSLNYSEVKVGTGPLGLPHKDYTVHYTGYLHDGTKFDSSVDKGKPFTFPIGMRRVIPGWDLGLQGMHVGGKRRLYVPWQLAYGERGNPSGGIPPKADLIFDIEFISQDDPKPPTPPAVPPTAHPATPPAGAHPATTPATPPPAGTTTPAASTTPKQ